MLVLDRTAREAEDMLTVDTGSREQWDQEVTARLRVVIVIMSASISSDTVALQQFRAAIEAGLTVIPVVVEGIASTGLRPLGDHEQPLVRAERRPVDGIEVVVDRDRRCLGRDVVVTQIGTARRAEVGSDLVFEPAARADDPGHDQPAMKAW